MFTNITCPVCGDTYQVDVSASIITKAVRGKNGIEKKLELEDIIIKNISKYPERINDILIGVQPYMRDGMHIEEVLKILRQEFKLSRSFSQDMVEKIKDFHMMYSPDGKHLHYIN
jgi:hypothetical protein